LDAVEERIGELERYIGVDANLEVDYFLKNEVEKMDQKCNRLDDFIGVIEDKNFLLSDLF
jgi:hypothetical protein